MTEQIMELDPSTHPYYVAVQYHPEYLSRPMKPSQPYLGLILAATGKLNHFLAKVRKGIGPILVESCLQILLSSS